MTNTDIIISEAVANEVYTMEEVEEILSTGHMIPLHTFATWKQLGYSVKKGQHAKITTKLWKYTNKKAKSENEEVENHYYLAKAFLFTPDQVEKIAQTTV